MDEIRRLKSLLVKHEKRIRALEARAAAADGATTSPASANSSLMDTTSTPTSTTPGGENHITHDTNANLAKQPSTTTPAEDMAPDEV